MRNSHLSFLMWAWRNAWSAVINYGNFIYTVEYSIPVSTLLWAFCCILKKKKKKSEKGQNFCILVHPSTMYMFNTWCVGHSPLTSYMWSHPLLFYSLSVLSLRVPPCTIKMLLSPRSTLVTTHVRKNTHLHNFNVCVPEQGAGNDASLKVHAEFVNSHKRESKQ